MGDGIILGENSFLGKYDEASGMFRDRQFKSNMEKLVASIVSYGRYKKSIYERNNPRNDLNVVDDGVKFAKIEKNNFVSNSQGRSALGDPNLSASVDGVVYKDASEKYANLFTQIGQFEAKNGKNNELVDKYCGVDYKSDPNRYHQELAKNIRNAVIQLHKDVSGQTKEIVEVRNFIEKLLVIFANSWETFKSSYILNFCLYGGAGVGKTTLAKAIARCLTAYGILATNYIKEANKADFIAQYLGQTVYKTDNTLYGSLEGVCFIDEAYAIGKTKDYGQEFLDELTFFTQKFPGCLCVIVAGYEKEMKRHFFEKNEGLYRRFPNTFELRPYDIDTINRALSFKVIDKLGITDQREKGRTENALKLHKTIIQLMYMDVTKKFTPVLENATINFPLFLVHSISTMSRLGREINPQKANILKVYMLHKYVGIAGGDFFPNQMGDVQNIVDKITMDSAISGGEMQYKSALKSINDYLRIRNAGYMFLNVDNSRKRFNFSFSASQQHPDVFTRNVLVPLAMKFYETPELYKKVHNETGSVNLTDDEREKINKNYDRFYTEAVLYLSDYILTLEKAASTEGDESKQKLSTHLVIDFLFQELERYKRLEADGTNTMLSFSEGVLFSDPSENQQLETSIGTIPVAKDHTPDAVCAAVPLPSSVPPVAPSRPFQRDVMNVFNAISPPEAASGQQQQVTPVPSTANTLGPGFSWAAQGTPSAQLAQMAPASRPLLDSLFIPPGSALPPGLSYNATRTKLVDDSNREIYTKTAYGNTWARIAGGSKRHLGKTYRKLARKSHSKTYRKL